MFDLPEREMAASERFSAELPEENDPWQIGLIVGPSGSGKTTIARAAFGRLDGARRWPRDRAVVDCFRPPFDQGNHRHADGRRLQFAAGVGQAVSRALPRRAFPLRPGAGILDRQPPRGLRRVHQRRRSHGRPHRLGGGRESRAADVPCRQFVAVTCHYDVAEWLEPDWVLDMAAEWNERRRLSTMMNDETTSGWTRLDIATCGDAALSHGGVFGGLRFNLRLHRTTADVWPLFARHHYLTAALNRSAHCYVGLLDGGVGRDSAGTRGASGECRPP